MADVLRKDCRKIDSKARIGGDKFALLLPDTDRRSSEFVLQRIKTDSEQEFGTRGWPISVLTGCVTEIGKKRGAQEILHEAEQVTYSGKSTTSSVSGLKYGISG